MKNEQRFEKVLTANDTGETSSHQVGVHIPKSNRELLAFFPTLDGRQKNPRSRLSIVDVEGERWEFVLVYYNNRLHDPDGTRLEYRLLHVTRFLNARGARSGDRLVLIGQAGSGNYSALIEPRDGNGDQFKGAVVRLRGWRRVH
jgi:hypothetical protein